MDVEDEQGNWNSVAKGEFTIYHILKDTGFDFFTVSGTISGRYMKKADQMLRATAYKNYLSDIFTEES